MKKISRVLLLLSMLVLLCITDNSTQTVDARRYYGRQVNHTKTVKASVSKNRVTAGKCLKIHAKTKQVQYSSSDSNIASVSKKGIVTGKRAGKVTITVKRAGYRSRQITLTVRVPKGKPSLTVACDEVKLKAVKMKKLDENHYQYSTVVHNTAKKGKVYQISYYYRIEAYDSENDEFLVSESALDDSRTSDQDTQASGEKTVILTAKNIKAGKKSSRVYCEGDISGKIKAMHLVKIKFASDVLLWRLR